MAGYETSLLYIWEFLLYICEMLFVQNDTKFIIIGTLFSYFDKKYFLCSHKTIK